MNFNALGRTRARTTRQGVDTVDMDILRRVGETLAQQNGAGGVGGGMLNGASAADVIEILSRSGGGDRLAASSSTSSSTNSSSSGGINGSTADSGARNGTNSGSGNLNGDSAFVETASRDRTSSGLADSPPTGDMTAVFLGLLGDESPHRAPTLVGANASGANRSGSASASGLGPTDIRPLPPQAVMPSANLHLHMPPMPEAKMATQVCAQTPHTRAHTIIEISIYSIQCFMAICFNCNAPSILNMYPTN